ncbi:MAG TPA: NAD(P)H-binding protein [Candidatus Binatia bacterium]|nr:NAD(P)H-binding protein [Candidatus Binatia bacterium]
MQTIAILGANGVYARWLIPRLTSQGHKVRALVRRPEAAGVANACGADVRIADIFDAASLRAGLAGADVALNLATSLPGPSGRGDFDANDRLRREGTPIFVQACRDAGVPRVLQQSVAMVNAAGERIADEDTRFEPGEETAASRAIAAALAMEDALRASGLDWLILRGGLFYGPGTGFDDEWFARAQAGKLRLPGVGTDYVSLLHIADMASATAAALARWPSRQTLIVADDEPAQWRDVFGYIATLAAAPAPQSGGRQGFPSFRVSNRRAREVLSWAPFYTNYRLGLVR